MLPHALQQSFNVIFLVMVSFVFIQKNASIGVNEVEECSATEDLEERNMFVSSLCSCGKKIQMSNETVDSNAFMWCSAESSMRGRHQRIVTYALFGNAHNASVFRRYYSNLRNISLTVAKQYPGYII